MEQKDLDKWMSGFRKCLVLRGTELVKANQHGEFSYMGKLIVHIVQHHYFKALDEYLLSFGELTDDQTLNLINKLKSTCPGISVTTDAYLAKRLPIKIGRWHVGNTDYVSKGGTS